MVFWTLFLYKDWTTWIFNISSFSSNICKHKMYSYSFVILWEYLILYNLWVNVLNNRGKVTWNTYIYFGNGAFLKQTSTMKSLWKLLDPNNIFGNTKVYFSFPFPLLVWAKLSDSCPNIRPWPKNIINIVVDKPGKHCFNQMLMVNIISNTMELLIRYYKMGSIGLVFF